MAAYGFHFADPDHVEPFFENDFERMPLDAIGLAETVALVDTHTHDRRVGMLIEAIRFDKHPLAFLYV